MKQKRNVAVYTTQTLKEEQSNIVVADLCHRHDNNKMCLSIWRLNHGEIEL